MTHELVQVHKGNISYDENEGGGSVFTVLLPTNSDIYQEKDFLIPNQLLTEEEEQHSKDFLRNETSEDTFQPPVDPLNKRKVLIIEDDTDIREFLREEIGVYFEVEVAADGTSGFEKASTYDADLIVCDVLIDVYKRQTYRFGSNGQGLCRIDSGKYGQRSCAVSN